MSILNFKVCSVAVVNVVLKENWEYNPVLFSIE